MHAYDADDTLAARLVENERMSGSVEFHHTDLTEVERFPAARIVYSTYTLGLLGPDALAEIWPKLVASLPRGGVMAVDMFGTNDTWATVPTSPPCRSRRSTRCSAASRSSTAPCATRTAASWPTASTGTSSPRSPAS